MGQWSGEAIAHLGDQTEGYIHEVAFHPLGFWICAASGQPGKGKFFFQRTGEASPFFVNPKLPNCHSVALHPNQVRMAIISNGGTFGQQKSMAREGNYPGNYSPINIWDLPESPKTA